MSPLLRLSSLLGCLTFATHAWQTYPYTDVVIVSNNDLDATNPNREGALFLRSAYNCYAAQGACAAYNETLLPAPNGTGFTPANLSVALASEKHGAAVETSQKIWIAGDSGMSYTSEPAMLSLLTRCIDIVDGCAAFTPNSQYTDIYVPASASPYDQYPVLCTNSAPLSRSNVTADTSR